MRRRLAALSLGVIALAAPARAGEAPPLLASAPVDAGLFRDGEVTRSAVPFGRWTLVCDAIARLGHKFCSLRAAPVPLGQAAVALLVSSGDDGRPAALLQLPLGLSLPFGLRVEPLGTGRQAPGRHAPGRHVPIALCSPTGCEAVWTLSPDEIAALRNGAGLRITTRGGDPDIGTHATSATLTATVPADGFADAITASLQ